MLEQVRMLNCNTDVNEWINSNKPNSSDSATIAASFISRAEILQ